MATKSKPVETPATSGNPRAPSSRGQVRYSVSKADLRERGIYEESKGLPLPNVADLMGYLLKGMVLFVLYTVVRGVWPDNAAPQKEPRPQLRASTEAPADGSKRESRALKQLENLNETINSATDSLVDQLRDLVGKDPLPPDL